MNGKSVKEFISKLLIESPVNNLKLYFSRWSTNKYITHLPQLSSELQNEIIDTVLKPLNNLSGDNIVNYNPIGVGDGEIEILKVSQIEKVGIFFDSIEDSNVFKELATLKVDKIDFQCIEISLNGKCIYLFRQFQKLKRLRKGIIAQIVNNELKTMSSNFLGIDELTDIIIFEKEVYIINHVSLERIFKYRDEFLKKTNEALGELLTKNVIVNIEQFTEDCCGDIRVMKRFTDIMTKGRLPLFFDNYDKVAEIVKYLNLDINFDSEGKLIYKERSQLFHIINLLSDSYFKTLLAERTGVAKIEGDL